MAVKPASSSHAVNSSTVCALVVLFKVALPRAIRLEAEKVDLIVEHFDVFAVARAPEAEHVLTLIEQHLAVEFFHFRDGVDVEHQRPAGGDGVVQAVECALHVARTRQIVDAVEAADRGVDAVKQSQLRHRLAQKQRRGIERGELLLRLREHFGRVVDASDRVAASGEEHGHRARAAGEVEQ